MMASQPTSYSRHHWPTTPSAHTTHIPAKCCCPLLRPTNVKCPQLCFNALHAGQSIQQRPLTCSKALRPVGADAGTSYPSSCGSAINSVSSRRNLLAGGVIAATAILTPIQCPAAQGAPAPASPGILSSGLALPGFGVSPAAWLAYPPDQASITNPGLSWALTDAGRQLYYPAWMEGTWSVTARLSAVGFPQGQRFINRDVPGVTKGSMIVALSDVGAGMEAPASWRLRFTASEDGRGVVADRVFNTTYQVNATLGYPAVRTVQYDPQVNPTRMSVVYATPRRGSTAGSSESMDLRKAEIFINNRGTVEELAPDQVLAAPPSSIDGAAAGVGSSSGSSSNAGFSPCVVWEMYRQVSQAARQGNVGDYLSITRLTPASANDQVQVTSVRGDMRVAAFLQPQDAAYFETGGRAVAVYDYTLQMARE